MNPSASGAAAEYTAAARFLSMGYAIYWPADPSSPCDLLIVKKGDFLKVQVKRAGWVPCGANTERLKVSTASRDRQGIKNYKYGDFDLLAAIDGDRMWLLPFEDCKGRSSVTLDNRGTGSTCIRLKDYDANRWLLPQP